MQPDLPDITPEDIGADLAPRLVPGLRPLWIGAELVVVGGPTETMVLNPTGALLFELLDGTTKLDDLIDELSEDLGADRSVVEADVLGFARSLGSNLLLEGVAPAPPGGSELGWNGEAPSPAEVGTRLDDVALRDLDGNARSLGEFGGRGVLLVNWNPGCGFCRAVAGSLVALERSLRDAGTELVFLSVGDPETNRSLMDQEGSTSAVLLRSGSDTDPDPFAWEGTPAALVLDHTVTVVEPVVVGAEHVKQLAAALAGEAIERAAAGARYLPAPIAVCGPGAAGSYTPGDDPWSGTRVYRFGDVHVGLRYDSDQTGDVLDRLFPSARVRDDGAPDNYSVALPASTRGNARGLNLLVHGSTQIVRSRSQSRVLAALLAHLSDALVRVPSGAERVRGTAALRDGEAFLLPDGLVSWMTQLQPRLARAGIQFVDVPCATIDLDERELVVPEPAIAHDASVLLGLDTEVANGAELRRVLPGRYPLTNWFLIRPPVATQAMTPAVAAVGVLPLFETDDVSALVARLGDMFGSVHPRPLWYMNADELVAEVVAGLDA